MGKLTIGLCLLAAASTALAEGVPQMYKDAIREHHTKMILGSGCGFHADSDTHSTHIRTVIPR